MYHQEMNKMKHENLILLIIALIIIIAPLVAYNGLGEDQGYFGGADDAGSDAALCSSSCYRCYNHRLCSRLLERSEKS